MSSLSLFSRRLLLSQLTEKQLEEEYISGSVDIVYVMYKMESKTAYGTTVSHEWLYLVKTAHPMVYIWQSREYGWDDCVAVYENINGQSVLSKNYESGREWESLNYIMIDSAKYLTQDEKMQKYWRDFQYLKQEQRSYAFYDHQEKLAKIHGKEIDKEISVKSNDSIFDNCYRPFIPDCCILEPMPQNYCWENIYLKSITGSLLDMDFLQYESKISTFTEDEQKEYLNGSITPCFENVFGTRDSSSISPQRLNVVRRLELPKLSTIDEKKF